MSKIETSTLRERPHTDNNVTWWKGFVTFFLACVLGLCLLSATKPDKRTSTPNHIIINQQDRYKQFTEEQKSSLVKKPIQALYSRRKLTIPRTL